MLTRLLFWNPQPTSGAADFSFALCLTFDAISWIGFTWLDFWIWPRPGLASTLDSGLDCVCWIWGFWDCGLEHLKRTVVWIWSLPLSSAVSMRRTPALDATTLSHQICSAILSPRGKLHLHPRPLPVSIVPAALCPDAQTLRVQQPAV